MKVVYPDGAIALLDLLADCDADQLWKKLSSGRLQTWRWETETGDFRRIDPEQWSRHVRVVEDGGHVVTRHPAELLERGDLYWITPPRWPGHDVRNDIVIVAEAEARRLFPKRQAITDKGGRPPLAAQKEWYAKLGFSRGNRTIKQLQGEMREATGRAASTSAIREWEKDAQKPPTES